MLLKIYLLGQFNLQAEDLKVDLTSRPAQSLLAYLTLNAGMSQRREKLAGLFWPEATSSNARSYLRQALWRIRKALEEAGIGWQEFLQINDIAITFADQSPYWLDAGQLLKPAMEQSSEELMSNCALYCGELLPGFYDEWVIPERDRMLAAYRQKMNLLLAQLSLERRWDEVVRWSEQWIRLDYAPEPAFRALMRAYVGLGDRGLVGATYQRCVESLERELGVEPSAETRQLYEDIRRREVGELNEVQTPVPQGRLPAFLKESLSPPADPSLFVAREHELNRLDAFLRRSLQGQGQVIFITGEAGGGKTALLGEFSRRAQEACPELVVASGNCNAHTGIGDPYLPFREILELLTGDVESRWQAGTISRDHALRLWQTVPLVSQTLVQHAPNLIDAFLPGGGLLERATAATSGEAAWLNRLQELQERKLVGGIIQGPQQDDLFEQMSKALQAVAWQVPLMLMVDDLQWADLGSISLLFHLGRNLRGSRILIVGAYRPEEVALGRDGRQHPLEGVVNELGRDFGSIVINVDEAQNRDFVEAILDSELNCLDSPFREMLYRQTRGNPLFTIELLRGMQARGDLVQNEEGQWVEGPRLTWEMLPARVEAVIAQRIGRLDKGLQSILRTASVEGEQFTAEVTGEIRGVERQAMLDCLSGELDRKHYLIRAHRIERRGGRRWSRYRFRHIQIQQYLYGSLDEVERVDIHERTGTILESMVEEEEITAAHAVQLARHFQEAGILEKAAQYRYQAGARAVQMTAFEEAIQHLNKSLALLHRLPDTRERALQELAVQLTLGMAWLSTGRPAVEMEQAFDRARVISRQVGEREQLAAAIGGLVIVNYVRANHTLAFAYAQEALTLAEEVQDPLQLMLAHWYLCFVDFTRGDCGTSRRHIREVLAIYDPEQHHQALVQLRGVDPGTGALAYDACCLWCLGYPEQAMKRRQKAVELAVALDHPFSLSDVLCFAACTVDEMRRDGPALKQSAEALLQLAEENGMPGWRKMAICLRGEALVLMGDPEAGIRILETSIAARSATDEKIGLPGLLLALAEAYMKVGEVKKAEKILDETARQMEESGERRWAAEVWRMQAVLKLTKEDEQGAEERYEAAIAVAQEQEAKSWELRAKVGLARLWQGQGKMKEAQQMLAEIYGWFSEGFETADLQAARTLLDEIKAK